MEIQKIPLPRTKSAHIDHPLRIHAHALQGRAVRHRGDDQAAIVLEADEATVKKMVNAWGQVGP